MVLLFLACARTHTHFTFPMFSPWPASTFILPIVNSTYQNPKVKLNYSANNKPICVLNLNNKAIQKTKASVFKPTSWLDKTFYSKQQHILFKSHDMKKNTAKHKPERRSFIHWLRAVFVWLSIWNCSYKSFSLVTTGFPN